MASSELFSSDDEPDFVRDLQRLAGRLDQLARAPMGTKKRAKLRHSLARDLLRGGQMLDLALSISLHVDDPDGYDYELVGEIHKARLDKIASEAKARADLMRRARAQRKRRS